MTAHKAYSNSQHHNHSQNWGYQSHKKSPSSVRTIPESKLNKGGKDMPCNNCKNCKCKENDAVAVEQPEFLFDPEFLFTSESDMITQDIHINQERIWTDVEAALDVDSFIIYSYDDNWVVIKYPDDTPYFHTKENILKNSKVLEVSRFTTGE